MEVEVSPDPDFRSETQKIRVAGTEPPLRFIETKIAIPVSTRPRLWYWRVSTIGGGNVRTEAEKFWIQPAPRPQPQFPPAQIRTPAGGDIELVWTVIEGAISYEVELLPKKQILTTSEPILKLPDLKPGKTNWRVRAQMKDGSKTPWSDPREFTVSNLPPPPPAELTEEVEKKQ
jgi:hypothetical protein